MSVTRKLAAIFYADVAGYTRLTGVDEEGTHKRVMDALDFTAATIGDDGGTVLRYAGDAVLAEFSSVLAAVKASIAIQKALCAQNKALPEDQRVLIRIGVNLGDVMEDRGEIYGDGVNLAARLESAAAPGGICISSAVHEQVHHALDIAFEDKGKKAFKNVAKPVHVYRWHPDMLKESSHAPEVGAVSEASSNESQKKTGGNRREKPSIVVLPFTNMSGDPEQEYFSDGISEDLITDLSKISGLFVIARNTAFTYKGQNLDLAKVSEDLNVRYVLEGSVRKTGDRVRITAQLIDGTTNGHIWAERYDRELKDIFAVQDEVTKQIVDGLRVHVKESERLQMATHETQNLAAYDCVLRARELFLKFTPEANQKAEACLKMAIDKDEDYAAAHAEMARILVQRRNHGWDDTPDQTLDQAYRMALRSVEIDTLVARSHIVKGFVHLWRHEHDRAMRELDRGLELEPHHADGHMWKAIVASFAGEPDVGVKEAKLAVSLNPSSTFWYLFALGNVCFVMGSYHDCLKACRQAVAENPNFIFAQLLLASALGHLGLKDEAAEALAECHRLNSKFSIDWARELIPYKDEEAITRFVQGLESAEW